MPVARNAPVRCGMEATEHAIEAPQGVYGYGADPLAPGEVWVQDTEMFSLSGQVGPGW